MVHGWLQEQPSGWPKAGSTVHHAITLIPIHHLCARATHIETEVSANKVEWMHKVIPRCTCCCIMRIMQQLPWQH